MSPACFAQDAPAQSPNRPIKDKWALVIGISKFKEPRNNLKYAAKDATDFATFLTSEARFSPDHVKVLLDEKATRANILSMLGDRWLPHVANPDDLVVIFISSHGSPATMDVVGVNYLMAHDTDPNNLFVSGIPMQDFVATIKKRVHSDRVVVFLDACHSGATTPDSKNLLRQYNFDVNEIAQGTGQLVISSSSPEQRSWEAQLEPNGVFTKCLIAALRKDGNTTKLGDAFLSLKDNVREQVLRERGILQTPVMQSKWEGKDLILASLPTQPRSGLDVSLPEEPAATPVEPQAHETQAAEIPKIWHSLEKNTWGTLLGTWIYRPERKEFDAAYDTGSTATLVLEEFGPERVRLSGRFQRSPTAPARGQEYAFTGTRSGKKVYGNVVYKHMGFPIKGRWEAWWD